MARNIYSFIKIEKRQTKRGIYCVFDLHGRSYNCIFC